MYLFLKYVLLLFVSYSRTSYLYYNNVNRMFLYTLLTNYFFVPFDIDMAFKIMTVNNMDKFYLLMVKGDEIRLYCVMNNNKQALCKEELIELSDI